MERVREEKDQEIMILQEGMDSTIHQLSEAQQVRILLGQHEVVIHDHPRTKTLARRQ